MSLPNEGTPQPPMNPSPEQPGTQETKLPLVSMILGIASVIQCVPIIGGVAAIVTGVMGRKRAREIGQATTMATVGILLGIVGILISVIATVVLFATGFAVFGVLSEQAKVADQLRPAVVAAEAYGASAGTYNGISTNNLEKFGFITPTDMTVTAVPVDSGNSFCIQGALNSDPENIIHVPVTGDGVSVSYTIDNRTYKYAVGACPTS